MSETTADVAQRGKQTLSAIADLVGDQGHTGNTRRLSRLTDQWRADRSALAESEEGRAAIAALMSDERPAVRLWSASAVLSWDEDTARPVLEEVRESPSRYGLHAIAAKRTLLEYDEGRLDGDALPGVSPS